MKSIFPSALALALLAAVGAPLAGARTAAAPSCLGHVYVDAASGSTGAHAVMSCSTRVTSIEMTVPRVRVLGGTVGTREIPQSPTQELIGRHCTRRGASILCTPRSAVPANKPFRVDFRLSRARATGDPVRLAISFAGHGRTRLDMQFVALPNPVAQSDGD
jgi:hypothetical protein